MAFSPKDWAIVQAFFEQGLSLAEIVARPEVKATGIKDRGSISRKATQEGWIKGKNATLKKTEVELKQSVADVESQKATLNATEREIHNTLVAEEVAAKKFFKGAHMLAARTAVMKLQRDGVAASYQDVKAAANTITAAQDGVLGKAPMVAIQNNNGGNTFDQSGSVVSNIASRADRMKAVRELLESRL